MADYYLMTNSGCRITKTVLEARGQVFRMLKKKFGDHLYLTSSGIEDYHTKNYAFRYDGMTTPASSSPHSIVYTHSRSLPERALQRKLDEIFSFRVLWEVPMVIDGIIYRYDFVAYNQHHLIFVEYDGSQHFTSMSGEGITAVPPSRDNDVIKTKFILEHGEKMIRICKEDHMLEYRDGIFHPTEIFDQTFVRLLTSSSLLAVNSEDRYRPLRAAV